MLSTGWMVPQLEEAQDFDLRRQELGLLEQVHRHPEQVARLAGQLLRQNAMQTTPCRHRSFGRPRPTSCSWN